MVYSRRQDLMCTEDELINYGNTVLLDREVLYIKRIDGSVYLKIGDGVTSIANLPIVLSDNISSESLDNRITTIVNPMIREAILDSWEGYY